MAKSDLWQQVCPLGLVLVPRRAGRLGRVSTRDPAGFAVRKLLLTHYRTLRLSARRATRGEDEEALHDLRIAVRSMRRLLEVFDRVLRGTSARRAARSLRAFAKRLGPARDLDVWMGILQRPRFASCLAAHPGFLARERRKQAAAQSALRALLGHPTTQSLMEQLGFLLRIELQEPGGPAARKPFASAAQRALRGAWSDFWDQRAWAKAKSAEVLHALRIRLRKLRLLAALLHADPPPRTAAFMARLHEIERALGRLHDLDEALRRAEQPDAPEPLRALLVKRRRKERRAFRALWRAFAATDPRAESAVLWAAFPKGRSGARPRSRPAAQQRPPGKRRPTAPP